MPTRRFTMKLSLRSSPVYWAAIALWAFVPGFDWLGKYLVVVEPIHAVT